MLIVDERQELAERLVAQAILAPSSHNTQPWWFRVAANQIDLFADRTRALPVNDPEDRELTLSCGCALMNLRIAAASQQFGTQLELLPDPADPDWLARLTLIPGGALAASDAGLVEFIPLRHTYRKPFADRPVEPTLLQTLRVLLTACQMGLQASYLNQPLQVQALRPEVQKLVEGSGSPQILLRLGYPLERVADTPRRRLEEVIAS
ncbi:MAG: hypothetical protein Q6M04_05675 [Thermostichus sp. BF3_bins_97]